MSFVGNSIQDFIVVGESNVDSLTVSGTTVEGGSGGSETVVEYVTLTPVDITNQFITLSETAITTDQAMAVDVISTPPVICQITIDFTFTDTTLTFVGGGELSLLNAGDRLRLIYNK